jgi:hypothetical protein
MNIDRKEVALAVSGVLLNRVPAMAMHTGAIGLGLLAAEAFRQFLTTRRLDAFKLLLEYSFASNLRGMSRVAAEALILGERVHDRLAVQYNQQSQANMQAGFSRKAFAR